MANADGIVSAMPLLAEGDRCVAAAAATSHKNCDGVDPVCDADAWKHISAGSVVPSESGAMDEDLEDGDRTPLVESPPAAPADLATLAMQMQTMATTVNASISSVQQVVLSTMQRGLEKRDVEAQVCSKYVDDKFDAMGKQVKELISGRAHSSPSTGRSLAIRVDSDDDRGVFRRDRRARTMHGDNSYETCPYTLSIKGSPNNVAGGKLRSEAARIIADLVPNAVASKAKTFAKGCATVVRVVMPSAVDDAMARARVVDLTFATGAGFSTFVWSLRVEGDRSLDDRAPVRALGGLWRQVAQANILGTFHQNIMVHKGLFTISDAVGAWPLFKLVEKSGGGFGAETCDEGLAKLGPDKTKAVQMAEAGLTGGPRA